MFEHRDPSGNFLTFERDAKILSRMNEILWPPAVSSLPLPGLPHLAK
jgi:hypothetical protein